MFGGSIGLTGGTDLVAFDGDDLVLTLGESCPLGICQYGGSQTLGTGTLSWLFTTENNESIKYNGVGGISGPSPEGTFTASDGIDSLTASYVFTSWDSDGVPDTNGYDGVDLNGTLTVTATELEGAADPNQAAFESMFSLPGTTSYSFTLDVGNCVNGAKAAPCIPTPDPSASFISLSLTPMSPVPESGAAGIVAIALIAVVAVNRRQRNASRTSVVRA